MHKVSSKQMNNIKKKIKFYNFDELCSEDNTKLIVKFHNYIDTVTYSDLMLNNGCEMYEFKKKILIEFIKKIINKVSEDNCIIVKYNEKWVVNKEEAPELANILANNSVTNKLKGGLLVNKNDKIVELFIESVFKYNSFIQIVFKDSKLIISPSDHMDIFFQAYNLNEVKNLIINNLYSCGDKVLTYELT